MCLTFFILSSSVLSLLQTQCLHIFFLNVPASQASSLNWDNISISCVEIGSNEFKVYNQYKLDGGTRQWLLVLGHVIAKTLRGCISKKVSMVTDKTEITYSIPKYKVLWPDETHPTCPDSQYQDVSHPLEDCYILGRREYFIFQKKKILILYYSLHKKNNLSEDLTPNRITNLDNLISILIILNYVKSTSELCFS